MDQGSKNKATKIKSVTQFLLKMEQDIMKGPILNPSEALPVSSKNCGYIGQNISV